MRTITKFVTLFMLFLYLTMQPLYGQEAADKQADAGKPELAGEIFGVPVPKSNYYFVMRVVLLFSSPWGSIPRTPEKLEKRIWDELLLSYEAFKRKIEVTQEELDAEIEKTIKAQKGDFNWRVDKEAYEEWTDKTLGEPVALFENQMRHLVQLRKLHNQILHSVEPPVTEEEAYQEFLNEYNSLSVEMREFDTLEEAQVFYDKAIKNSEFWDKEKAKDEERIKKIEEDTGKKERGKFRRPGFVALEFLMQMWKFPKEAVFDMIEMEPGSIYKPAPIYKGYGVFKILEVRRAVKEEFPKRRESYINQLRNQKRYKTYWRWLKQYTREAKIKKYIKPPEGIFSRTAE